MQRQTALLMGDPLLSGEAKGIFRHNEFFVDYLSPPGASSIVVQKCLDLLFALCFWMSNVNIPIAASQMNAADHFPFKWVLIFQIAYCVSLSKQKRYGQ